MAATTPQPATAAQYRDLLARLLPPGPVWILASGFDLDGILLAIGDALTRVHNRALGLLDDADPRTVSADLIGDWERVLGLPCDCVGIPATLAERRALVWARWISKGGQNAAYFIQLAAALGLTITIDEPLTPFVAGDPAGKAIWGNGWVFGWIVHCVNGPIVEFRAGSRCGYRLLDARQVALECTIGPLAPSHTIPVYSYHP